MNTYMLSAIICKLTNQSLMDYISKRLFLPLGIQNAKWELCPEGVERGGWGLHLSLSGMLKIGMFLANDGAYNGRQLIHPSFIRKMKKNHVKQDVDSLAIGYGYQLWNLPYGYYMLSGMYGQHVIIDEQNKLIIATNAHNDKLFPDSILTTKILHFLNNNQLKSTKNKVVELKQYQNLVRRADAFACGYDLKLFQQKQLHFNYLSTIQKIQKQNKEYLTELLDAFNGKQNIQPSLVFRSISRNKDQSVTMLQRYSIFFYMDIYSTKSLSD